MPANGPCLGDRFASSSACSAPSATTDRISPSSLSMRRRDSSTSSVGWTRPSRTADASSFSIAASCQPHSPPARLNTAMYCSVRPVRPGRGRPRGSRTSRERDSACAGRTRSRPPCREGRRARRARAPRDVSASRYAGRSIRANHPTTTYTAATSGYGAWSQNIRIEMPIAAATQVTTSRTILVVPSRPSTITAV